MTRTLLTGFGPFRNVVDNPTARIVAHFERVGAPGHELTTRVLPVSFVEAGREVSALLAEGAFDVALLMGVARRADGFRFEQFGRYSDPDTVEAERPVPDSYPGHLVFDAIVAELEAAGMPAEVSSNAGGFVCDHTYYCALRAIAEGGLATRCLFLHVPADEQTFAEPPTPPPALPETGRELALPLGPTSVRPTMALSQQIAAVGRVLGWLSSPIPGSTPQSQVRLHLRRWRR